MNIVKRTKSREFHIFGDIHKRAFFEKGIKEDELNLDYKFFNEKHRDFYEKKKIGKGNQSDFVHNAFDYSVGSLLIIDYLLKNPQYLETRETKWLDDVFSAHTMESVLKNMLKETDKPEPIRRYRQDFKTTDLARLFFEIGMEFLKESTTDSKFLHTDIERIAERFKELSHTRLESETFREHRNESEKQMTKKHEMKLRKDLQKAQFNFNKFYTTEEFNSLNNEIRRLRWEQGRLEIKLNSDKNSKEIMKILQNQLKDNELHLKQFEKKLKDKKIELYDEIQKIKDELLQKHQHVKTFYCKLNPLPQFKYDMQKKKFPIPEKEDMSYYFLREYGTSFDLDSIVNPHIETKEHP